MSAHSGACEEVLPTCEVPLRLCEAGPGGDLDSGGSRAELPRRLRLFIHAGINLITVWMPSRKIAIVCFIMKQPPAIGWLGN